MIKPGPSLAVLSLPNAVVSLELPGVEAVSSEVSICTTQMDHGKAKKKYIAEVGYHLPKMTKVVQTPTPSCLCLLT